MARTSSLIAQVQPILQRVPCSNETLPNAPKHYEMLQNMSLVPMGWIECFLYEKFRCDFMAQICALIAPVQPVLHRVDKCTQTLEKTHQNMSLGSNGLDRVRSLRKISTRFRGMKYYINCTSSARFETSFRSKKGPKCAQTVQNAPKYEFRVKWGGSGAVVVKNSTRLRGTNFGINCTNLAHSAPSFML